MTPTYQKIQEDEKKFDKKFVQDYFSGTVRMDAIFGDDVKGAKEHNRSSLIAIFEGEIERLKGEMFLDSGQAGQFALHVDGHNDCLDQQIEYYKSVIKELKG